jgi:ubiquinone biosynthesis monooxygenase Coq7
MERSRLDTLLIGADSALRTLTGVARASRARPETAAAGELSEPERRLAGSLMRVNHVGEVCAQALYQAQALATADPIRRHEFEQAAREETDHLAWTRARLDELGARPSLLNPLWYAGAFTIGLLAGRAGDAVSLGFVVETERQVEEHLAGHLERLPEADAASRAIVEQMKADEVRHAEAAESRGAVRLPAPVRWAMRAAARVMTSTAHHL